MRILFGMVALVAAYLGWRMFASEPGRVDAAGMFERAKQPSAPTVAGPQGAKPTPTPSTTERPPATGRVEALVRGIRSGDAASLAVGFQELRGLEGASRSQLANALLHDFQAAQSGQPPAIEQMFRALGKGNSFVHSAEGRQAASALVAQIHRLPAEAAVQRSSDLLLRCISGSIEKSDTAAYDFVNELYGRHSVLVDSVVFNPSNLTRARSWKVERGHSLDRIAAAFRRQKINVEGWTLCFLNRIGHPSRLQAGQTIKIPTDPIWARVTKGSYTLSVFVGETLVRLYWVGLGKNNSTPETVFRVLAKVDKPDWNHPNGQLFPYGHPENVLGKYFVKFEHATRRGFGAHGTNQPETIRTQASLGCVRMGDADIEEFFRFIPRGAKIEIVATGS